MLTMRLLRIATLESQRLGSQQQVMLGNQHASICLIKARGRKGTTDDISISNPHHTPFSRHVTHLKLHLPRTYKISMPQNWLLDRLPINP
jgi:ubiquitin-protein ligase